MAKIGWVGALLLAVLSPTAHAGILGRGVFLITQDLSYTAVSNQWIGTNLVKMDKYAGATGASLGYFKSETTLRMGARYGLMFDASIPYQKTRLSTAKFPYRAGELRGGTTFVKLGVTKQIFSVLGDPEASLLPDSALGDLEVFGGIFLPTREREPLDFFTNYEGSVKANFGLRHTYFMPIVNPETVIGGFARYKLPAQGFVKLQLNLHWEANPWAFLRYAVLAPYVTAFNTFGGHDSSTSATFLSDWTASGQPPFLKLNTRFLAMGVYFMRPFNYTWFLDGRFNRVVTGKNMLQQSEFGLSLNHLF